jgi:hypothetical protein
MEHVVFFPAPDGNPGFGRFSSMDEAVSFVERLRNVDGVGEAELYALTPVPMVVKTYYRVEVPPVEMPAAVAEAPAVATPAPVAAAPAPAPAPVEASAPVEEAAADPDSVFRQVQAPQPTAEVPEQAPVAEQPVEAAEPEGEPVAAGAGTPDIIAPATSGRRSLGFFSH